ncbi:hypothetical protein [Sphaerisporangium rubeum]|uniref:Uncharacterized protein n=1 Tax=Sphaerisporangium rubeum TaxID=321317 RepID=A0A7X0M876_9ACTN|nr:hypothetical protein [Sphaerisporangium rubeum]MBB6475533.1 hypothetical protein [Sphaerisporangium rubeum]
MTDPRPNPARVYAHAAARTLTGGPTSAPVVRADDATRDDVALARRQA